MSDDLLTMYKRDLKRHFVGRLSADEQAQLAREGRHDELVASLLPLVMHVLRDVIAGSDFEVDQDIRADLLQAGNLALMVATKSWKPAAENSMALSSWVCKSIHRDMLREFAKQKQVVSQVFEEETLGLTSDFETLVTQDGYEILDIHLPDGLVTEDGPEAAVMEMEARNLAALLLQKLTDSQRKVLILTEIQGLSLREAGNILGISHQATAQARGAALKKMRCEVDDLATSRHELIG